MLLFGASLVGASLVGTDFARARLCNANLAGTDLSAVRNLTQARLAVTRMDSTMCSRQGSRDRPRISARR